MTTDETFRSTLAQQSAGPGLYAALLQIERLMRETDPTVVDLPTVAGEIARAALESVSQPGPLSPAPWRLTFTGLASAPDYAVYDAAGNPVVHLPPGNSRDRVRLRNDGALIEAAPELFEAAAEALRCIERHVPPTVFAPRERLRDLIRRATPAG